MPEPILPTAGAVSLTAISIALIGPVAGPYVLITLLAMAGSLWPLSVARGQGYAASAMLMLRCTLTAIVLTSLIAQYIERQWGIPTSELLAAVAWMIGAFGNGWRPVIEGLAGFARRLIPQGQQK